MAPRTRMTVSGFRSSAAFSFLFLERKRELLFFSFSFGWNLFGVGLMVRFKWKDREDRRIDMLMLNLGSFFMWALSKRRKVVFLILVLAFFAGFWDQRFGYLLVYGGW